MKLTMNTRIVNNQIQVNCLGYFQSDWFNLDSLLKRQKEIYNLISNKKINNENIDELSILYDVTENMRVKMLTIKI